jgi:2-haloacid dehalogenase
LSEKSLLQHAEQSSPPNQHYLDDSRLARWCQPARPGCDSTRPATSAGLFDGQALAQNPLHKNQLHRNRASGYSPRLQRQEPDMSELFVFDAYGTLFDVHAAAARQREVIGANWERLSQTWRQKHLEYSWIHAQTGVHVPFWILTERSLDFAIASVGGVPAGVREELLAAYRKMDAFTEVPAVLAALKKRGAKLAILSNGDPDMLADAVSAAKLDGVFDAVISVQDAGIFKPSMRVYQLVLDRFGGQPAGVTFMSSNRWDVAGAKVFDFQTVWINRSGAPEEYPDMPAGRVARDLNALIA